MKSENPEVLLRKCLAAANGARLYLQAQASEGNEQAMRKLVAEAISWNDTVEQLRTNNVQLARKVAGTFGTWPGNFADHPAAVDAARLVLRELGVAEKDGPMPIRVRADSPVQSIATDIIDWLEATRAAGKDSASVPWEKDACGLFPLLHYKTNREWFDCGWLWYESMWRGDVTNDPRAKKIAGDRPKGRNKPRGYVKDQVYKATGWWRRRPSVRR